MPEKQNKSVKKRQYVSKKLKMRPIELRIADLYLAGERMKTISETVQLNRNEVRKIIYKEQVQKYIKEKIQNWESYSARMADRLLQFVEKQIEDGKKEVKTFYDKEGNVKSKMITRTELSIKECMDMSRLAKRYFSTLTMKSLNTTKDEDKHYKEVLEHLENTKNMEVK